MAEENFRITRGGTLFKYNGKEAIVSIPSHVKYIGQAAFEQNNYIKEIIVPSGLSGIDNRAFADCKNLERLVHFTESSVTYIGGAAFAGCEKLDVMQFPSTLIELFPSVFEDSGLITAVIPEKTLKIPHELFKNSKWLSTIIFKATSDMQFDDNVFDGCENLKYITFESDNQVKIFDNPGRILGSAKPDFLIFKTFALIRNPADNKWCYAKRDEKGNFSVR